MRRLRSIRDVSAKSASVFGDDSRSFGESLSGAVPAGHRHRRSENGHRQRSTGNRDLLQGGGAWIRHSRWPSPQAGERAPGGEIEQRSGRAARGGRSSVGCGKVGAGRVACARGASVWRWRIWGVLMKPINNCGRRSSETGPASVRAQHLAMRNLGTLLRLQGRYVDSLQWLEKSNAASAIQPSHRGDHAHGLLEAGLARLELGELDAAQHLFTRAEALFNDVQQAAHHARARRSAGRYGASAACSVAITPVRCNVRRKPICSGATSIRRAAGRVKLRCGLAACIWRLGAMLKRSKR